MYTRAIFFVFLFSLIQGLNAQAWRLHHQYPLELPGKVRYAQFPDSLLSFYKAEGSVSLEEVRDQPQFFQAIPESIRLEQGDVYWLKGVFVHSDTTGRPFLVEADGFREMKHIGEVMEKLWSEVDVYLFVKDSLVQHISSGSNVSPKERLIRDARNLFWIRPNYQGEVSFFIRLQSKVDLKRPGFGVRIYDQKSLYDFAGFTFKGFDEKPDTYRSLWPVKKVLSVWNSLEYVIDTMQTHTFADLQESWDMHARYFLPEFAELTARNVLWCRLKVVNDCDSTQLYWFDAASNAPKIEAYIPDGTGDHRKVLSGKKIPMMDKQIPHTLSLISFELSARDSGYIYIKYYNSSRINNAYLIPLFFLDRKEVLTKSRSLGLWKAFILGIFIFQIIYFALRASLERDRLGAYYLLFILGFLSFFLSNENRVNTFMAWQILMEHRDLLLSFGYGFTAVGIFLFSNRYLQLKRHFPRFLNLLKVNLLLVIISLLLSTIQISSGEYFDLSPFYSLPFTTFMLFFLGALFLLYVFIAIYKVIKGHAHALSYLLAFFPFCLVALMNSFQGAIQGELPIWRINLLYLSYIITNILFAIVVAKRNNAVKMKEVQAANLIELNRAKSRFYDHITHEFRTPLTVIRGMANMIRGHEEEKVVIQKNSQEVLNLVDQLIEFSKTQSGIKPLRLVEDNILVYLEYLMEALHPVAREKHISLLLHHEQEEIIISFDRDKFRLIFNNLLTNAIKYTHEGGAIQVSAGINRDKFELVVEDNGIGIDEEELSKIFDRYYQIKDPLQMTDHIGGIGLVLIKEEVARLEGSINVESKKGAGTAFTVKLPLHPAPDGQEKSTTDAAEAAFIYPTQDERVVLLVEDHPDVRYYLDRLLSAHYKIVTTSDGEEGFNKATELIPDIIISDVMMPNMDGYHLTAKLKEDLRTSHIPIILLTAKSKHQDRLQGLSGGADAYLIKPFEEEELKIRIKKLIENREHLSKVYAQFGNHDHRQQHFDPFLEKANQVLEENFDNEDFGAAELVRAMDLSRMQVHRKLKALTNLSSSQFINQFRLERSRKMLFQNKLNISEVAYSCGFTDPAYFSKLFSKAYGQSPLQFRDALQA